MCVCGGGGGVEGGSVCVCGGGWGGEGGGGGECLCVIAM